MLFDKKREKFELEIVGDDKQHMSFKSTIRTQRKRFYVPGGNLVTTRPPFFRQSGNL